MRDDVSHYHASITQVDNLSLLDQEPHTPVMAVIQGNNEGALEMAHEGANNTRTKHMHRRHFIFSRSW